jgi:hypothetical protein
VSRSRIVSTKSCEGLGAGRGFHSSTTGSTKVGDASSSNVATSTPDTPSIKA